MKKYVKPDVLFEDFEMSVGVAACTGVIIGADGNPKDINNPEIKQLIEFGLFGDPCPMNYKTTEDIGYFGGLSAMFGS